MDTTTQSDSLPVKAALNLRAALSWWPALLALGIFALIFISTLSQSFAMNNGVFTYALDDAYIHMSIARHFIQHGTWGINAGEFSSATSSPLWTLLLALVYALFGVNDYAALALNLICAGLLLLAFNVILRRFAMPGGYIFVTLLAVIIALPLDALVFAGMEHTLHALLTIVFAAHAAHLLSRREPVRLESNDFTRLWSAAMLLCAARYEGLFLVFAVCLLFGLRRWWMRAAALGLLGAMPLAVYGMVAYAHGWWVIPTSIQLKSQTSYFAGASLRDVMAFFTDTYLYTRLRFYPVMWTTLVIAALLFLRRYTKIRVLRDETLALITILVITLLLHVRLVPWEGPLLRYEMYLVTLALLVMAAAAAPALPRRLSVDLIPAGLSLGLAGIFLLYPWYERVNLLRYQQPVPVAMQNIYRQQYQISAFLQSFYGGQVVAVNDIGAMSYYTDLTLIDLWGLATHEAADARLNGFYTVDFMREVTRNRQARIAIIYDSWFHDLVPEEWVRVMRWRVDDDVILGDDTVSFYAINPGEAQTLADALWIFSASLPAGVTEINEFVRDG